MNYLDRKISVYKNVADTIGSVTNIRTFLTSDKYKNKVDAIRKAETKEKRNELKKNIPAATLSGVFDSPRSDLKLKEHSGLICIDIDSKDNLHIKNFDTLKSELCNLKEVLYCGLSVSGNGYFILIPIAYPSKHREHFKAIREDFVKYGINIDESCVNISRLRLFSYDSTPYINENAVTYKRLIQPAKKTYISCNIDASDNVSKIVSKAVKNGINMTDSYYEWFSIGCALASEMGESGRSYFHELSKMSSKYKTTETDKKYDECKKVEKITIGTFYQIAADYGIRFRE